MTYENNLGVVLPTDAQTNKVATIADALLRVSEAVSSRMSYDFTAGDVNATLDQFQRNGLHLLRNVTVARNFVLPVAKRWAYIASDLANTANATIVLGTASYVLTPGTAVFVATDGTANGLSVYGLGAVPGVPEAPNDANAYVRKGDAWTVLSAVPEAPNDASAYMRKGLAWVPYTAPAAGIPEAPNDANGYLRHALGWVAYVAPAAGLADAPNDGILYGRKSGAWSAVPTGGTGTALIVKDEGTTIETAATALNFVGAGVTVSDTSGVATITVPGSTGGGGSTVSYGGVYGAAVGNYTQIFDGSPALPNDWTYSATNDVQFFTDADTTSGTTNTLTFRDVLNNQTCYINIPIVADATHNTVTIRFKTSSEGASDFFRIFLDGVQQAQYSGTTAPDWQTYTINGISAGSHTVKLQFSKDGSVDAGIDNVRFSKLIYPKVIPAAITGGTVVTYSGRMWMALATNPADAPSLSSTNWAPFATS